MLCWSERRNELLFAFCDTFASIFLTYLLRQAVGNLKFRQWNVLYFKILVAYGSRGRISNKHRARQFLAVRQSSVIWCVKDKCRPQIKERMIVSYWCYNFIQLPKNKPLIIKLMKLKVSISSLDFVHWLDF